MDPGDPEVTSGHLTCLIVAKQGQLGLAHCLSAGGQIREGSKCMHVALPAHGLLYPALGPFKAMPRAFRAGLQELLQVQAVCIPGLR